MSRILRQCGLLLLVALCTGMAAHAHAASPQVRGQVIRDFARLTFEWPETTLFTAKTSGNNIILSFDRKANPNMGAVLKQLSPYVVKAQRKADGKTIVLTLDKPHRIRTFISDNVSGIDILDIKGGKNTRQASVQPMLDKQKPAKKNVAAAKKDKPAAKKIARIKDEAYDLARLTPSAGEAEAPAAPAVAAETPKETKAEPEPVAEPLVKAEPAAAPPAEEAPKEVAVSEEVPKEEAGAEIKTEAPKEELAAQAAEAPRQEDSPAPAAPPPAPTPEARADTPKEMPKAEEVKEQKPLPKPAGAGEHKAADAASPAHDIGVSMVPMSSDRDVETESPPIQADKQDITSVESAQDHEDNTPLTSNKIVVSADADGATLRVPLKERAAMALFIRMNSLWIVFDKKLDFDLSDFEDLPRSIISKAALLPSDTATILRIPVSDNIYASVRQQEGQLDLAIILSEKNEPIDKAMAVTISTEPPAPAHIFLPALEVGAIVEARDPDIGDSLLITPVYTREQGINNSRDFVDFTLLASTQGVVLAKKADATEVTVLRNGIRISLPKGANLSPQVAGADMEIKTLPPTSTGTLFPDEMWMLDKSKSQKIAINNLVNQTVFAANEGAKNLARLRLAQVYLRDGFAVEAIGMLDIINRINPAYYRSAKLAAMRGAANFLLYRFNDAARDFGAAELNNNPEIAYWRDMLADLLGSPDKTNNFLAMNDSYISKYPPIFRQRLAIVAADRAIAAKEYNAAMKIFDSLSKDEIIAPIQPYVDFLTAKISAENGQEAEALEVWKRLAADSPNQFVRARASFSEILWELDNNMLTREQAMDKLERLRLRWHGDGLELQVVQLLGDLYFEQQDYVNAMRVWQIGVTGFKNTGPAVEMARKMEDTFIKLFNEGIAEKMTPLEALALYYEYRNYTPTGNTGIQMIEKLADRLIGVDLLSTAAQLLEQQMRTQMEKAERSRVGAKLAEVYLMNNQPKRALKALQDSVYGDNPILQRIYRNQLAARVMVQLGRPQEALAVLGQDESVGAEKLRAMIYWSEKDWPNMTASIENLLKKREDPSAPLTAVEAEFVLRLALAYVYQGDEGQLQYMRDYFGPLLKGNPYQQAFDFVTSPDVELTTRNFDELLASLAKTRGFVNGYKARVEIAEVN